MLPPFIIDQIRRREVDESRRRDYEQPRLELPVDVYQPAPEPASEDRDRDRDREDDRGVIILDLG